MKNNSFLALGILVMVLIFGFVMAGCATAEAPTMGAPTAEVPDGDESNNEEKTIVITGFGQSGITPLKGDLIDPDWDNWTNIASGRLVLGTNYDGETATIWLWTEGKDGERWTGTGEYSLILEVIPAREDGKISSEYYLNRNVIIKEAETTVQWSDFEYGWEND
jgi:hypothetical protein